VRSGAIFRRCTKCGGRLETQARAKPRCSKCGGDNFSWAYVVDVAPKGAPRQQKTRSGFATKDAAVAAAAELQTSITSGSYIAPNRRTVAKYLIDEWLPAVRPPAVRGSTWRAYRDNVARHIAPRIGNVPLQQLTRATVKALYADLTAAGGRNGQPLSVKTVHNVHLTLRSALGDAVSDRIIASNPADGAHTLPRDRGIEMKTWTAKELALFLSGVRESEWYPLLRLTATTGMRRGEVLGLRWRDSDLDAGVVQVVQQRVRGIDGMTYGPPKTARGKRSINLDPLTRADLREHRRRQLEDRMAFGPGYEDADLVFARADGTPMDPDVVSATFERLSRRLGLPRIRLHDLRHTHATLALSAGIHPKVVQERLGHSSVSVTMDTYSHAIPAMQADAADRIAALVDGTTG
jgi:integrase